MSLIDSRKVIYDDKRKYLVLQLQSDNRWKTKLSDQWKTSPEKKAVREIMFINRINKAKVDFFTSKANELAAKHENIDRDVATNKRRITRMWR